MRKGLVKKIIASVVGLMALASIPTSFATWNTGGGKTPVGDSANYTPAIGNPVCYNGSTNTVYHNLKIALDEATSGQYVYMYIGVNYTCNETITIKSGVHLVLPFKGKHYNASATGNNVASTPKYKIDSIDESTSFGNTLGDASSSSVQTYRSIVLNMRNQADIVVNGYLHLGGAYSTKGNNGYYSEINLGQKCSITCNSGSTFDCYGYVKENSGDAKNSGMTSYENQYCNEYDADRYIKIKSNATLNTYFCLYDAQSRGQLTGLISANQCPFYSFDFAAMQTYVSYESGCIWKGDAMLYGPSDQNVMKTLTIVDGQNPSSQQMFYINSGSLDFEYMTTNVLYSSRSIMSNPTRIIVNGTTNMGYLYISEYGGQVKIDTSDASFFLPISCKNKIYIKSGSSFRTDYNLKFLRGSSMLVDENATFTINAKVIFYDSVSALPYSTDDGVYYNYTGSDDALLVNNGTLVFNSSGNKGAIGAYITHTNTAGTALLNFNGLSSDNGLSVTCDEGTVGKTVTIVSSGDFYDNSLVNAQFSSGTEYTSGYSNGNYYWEGSFQATRNIVVSIANGILNPIFSYTIKTATTSNGSDASGTSATDATEGKTIQVPNGNYFNINVSRAYSVTITKQNGTTVNYNASSWILVDQNFSILITPNEGVTVNVTTFKDTNYNDKEDTWSAGLGHTYFYVQECSTQNGTYTEIKRVKASSITAYVQKGYYFKVGYTWDQSDTIIGASGQNGFTANNTITTNMSNFAPQPNSTWNNNTTSSLSPAFLAGNSSITGLVYNIALGYYTGHAAASGSCLLPSALVTMADGSLKAVRDIVQGDLVKVFNHETGEIDIAPITFNDHDDATLMTVLYVNFSNGKTVGIIYEHGFFDLDTMRYEYIREDNYQEFIGHRFYTEEGDEAILTSVDVRAEYTECYSPTSFYHFDYFVEGMLSMPGGITGLFNIFEFGEDLKYDEEAYNRDIETYGLFTYEDLAPLGVTEIMFEAYAGKYLKVALGKGILTEEYLEYLIARYGGFTEEP